MNNILQKLEEKFKSHNFATMIITNGKLQKSLLVAMKKQSHGKIVVMDESKGLNEVGIALYNINANGVYLSEFVVDEDYQQCGIGTMMFNLAMAHGDAKGVTQIYGEANPIDQIKGVSKKGDYDLQKKVTIDIYKKLGCTIKNEDEFNRNWQECEILASLGYEERKLIEKVLEDQSESEK